MHVARLSFLALLLFVGRCAGAAEPVRFNRDVRAILSAKCYRCHGPDESHREAELRLDQRDAALADRDGVRAIVPGKIEESELWHRVSSDDPAAVMPPPEAKLELTGREIEILRDWIAQGARYEGHWSFIKPATPAIPCPPRGGVVRNPIDAFVQRQLLAKGLRPSPEADRRTLIRRATLDLWGLPPTPGEIEAFLGDKRPDAYERLIDRLLDSPRYSERMTLAWMDAARYGDTSVFHADGPRDMWPWRDWVLKAYSTNMPFDQFTIEQLAGDLLPNANTEQIVATGFNRNHGTTDEGGAIDEEYRVEYIVDRVKTTSMVWLGLTMECAQCHDHKYDPITQQDYYRFFAYFNQTGEKGMQTRNGNAEPRALVPTDAQQDRLAALDAELSRLKDKLANARPSDAEVSAWIDQHHQAGAASQPELGQWYRLGPFDGGNLDGAFRRNFGPEKRVDLKKKHGNKTWQPEKEWQDGQVISLDQPANNATYVYRTITVDQPTKLPLSLGSDDTITVWHNHKQVLSNKTVRGALPDQEALELDLVLGENQLLLKICNGDGPSGFYFHTGRATLPADIAAAVLVVAADRTPEQNKLLDEHYTQRVWPTGQQLREEIRQAEKRRADFENTIPTVMVMRDMSEPRMTYVLDRGHYASPKKEQPMQAATPSFLPSLGAAEVPSRLGLATWLTSPDHPLTARVAVNRYWTMLFGRGIVATVADFGSQGAWPSHPELLDYLARDFVESGWNVKRMLRQIMTSATYRQSSRVTHEHLAIDPQNIYLARAPRLRLEAEFIRDIALSLAGLLVERVGGPGVKPYQPPGLWNEVSLSGNVRFQQDHGEKLYRRTMYTYWKRSSPQPAMLTFDVPTREKCVIQRQRTNTPLQALVTLNDVQFVEAARGFAERILASDVQDDAARLDVALVLATGRPADNVRRRELLQLLDAQRQRYQHDKKHAELLLSLGESPRNKSLALADHAAWTIVGSVILNLDETLNKE